MKVLEHILIGAFILSATVAIIAGTIAFIRDEFF